MKFSTTTLGGVYPGGVVHILASAVHTHTKPMRKHRGSKGAVGKATRVTRGRGAAGGVSLLGLISRRRPAVSRVPAVFVHAAAGKYPGGARGNRFVFSHTNGVDTWLVLVHAPQRTDVGCVGYYVPVLSFVSALCPTFFLLFFLVLAVSSVWRSENENPEKS